MKRGEREKRRKGKEEKRRDLPLIRPYFLLSASLWFVSLSFPAGCHRTNTPTPGSSPPSGRVVLYCSVDDVYAKPIIRDLEKKTGLRIDALYDTEATKTAGLASRIRAEKNRPRGDVFWSSALLQTLLLKREGLLQSYQSPSTKDVPAAFKDAQGAWTGLGVRARVIVYHRSVKNPARSLQDLLQPRFRNQVAISNPQFGTASDWVAALATRWGITKTLEYFRGLKRNGVRVLSGNSVVADRVHLGELLSGVTDTDDFFRQWMRSSNGIRLAKMPNATQWPIDAPLVPGSVAMLKNAPHPEAARRLVDVILSRETEKSLAQQMPGVIPLRDTGKFASSKNPDFSFAKQHPPDDTARWPAAWDKIREPLAEILLLD